MSNDYRKILPISFRFFMIVKIDYRVYPIDATLGVDFGKPVGAQNQNLLVFS